MIFLELIEEPGGNAFFAEVDNKSDAGSYFRTRDSIAAISTISGFNADQLGQQKIDEFIQNTIVSLIVYMFFAVSFQYFVI